MDHQFSSTQQSLLMFDKIVFLEPPGQRLLGDAGMWGMLWKEIVLLCQEAVAGSLLSNFDSPDSSAFDDHILRMQHLDRTLEGKRSDDLEDFRRARWTANLQRIDGRYTLLTSKGHVGWAPPAAEITDVVAVFPGCHVPVVIRRVHVEKVTAANLVFTHDATHCTQSSCEGQHANRLYYRIIGETCLSFSKLSKTSLLTNSRRSGHNGGRGFNPHSKQQGTHATPKKSPFCDVWCRAVSHIWDHFLYSQSAVFPGPQKVRRLNDLT